MKRKLRRGVVLVVMGFAVLFVLRLGYGCLQHPDPTVQQLSQRLDLGDVFAENERRNYASSKLARKGKGVASFDQKNEKIAQLTAQSRAFEADERRVREAIESHAALVQFERQSGLAGGRALHLGIGVDPNRFDSLTSELRRIGRLLDIHVHKVDKTNDYRELQAKRASLEQTRAALQALKGQGGRIDELVKLEERVLEIEERIQNLGIQLGDFDEENEFCTVKLTLIEQPAARTIPWHHRVKVAFEWTLVHYLKLLGIVLGGALLALVVIALLDRIGAIRGLVHKLGEKDKEPPT